MKDTDQIVAEALEKIKMCANEKFVPMSFRFENDIRLAIQTAVEKATEYEKRLREDAERSVQRLLKSGAAHERKKEK